MKKLLCLIFFVHSFYSSTVLSFSSDKKYTPAEKSEIDSRYEKVINGKDYFSRRHMYNKYTLYEMYRKPSENNVLRIPRLVFYGDKEFRGAPVGQILNDRIEFYGKEICNISIDQHLFKEIAYNSNPTKEDLKMNPTPFCKVTFLHVAFHEHYLYAQPVNEKIGKIEYDKKIYYFELSKIGKIYEIQESASTILSREDSRLLKEIDEKLYLYKDVFLNGSVDEIREFALKNNLFSEKQEKNLKITNSIINEKSFTDELRYSFLYVFNIHNLLMNLPSTRKGFERRIQAGIGNDELEHGPDERYNFFGKGNDVIRIVITKLSDRIDLKIGFFKY